MHPIEQFKIHTLIPMHIFGLDISFTNASLAMMIACLLAIGLPLFAVMRGNGALTLLEMSFEFVGDTMQHYAHNTQYFPFIFSIFLFVLFANMLGLIPHMHTATSHIIVTLTLALIIYSILLILGIIKKGLSFFRMFLPSSVPLYLAPLFIPIEPTINLEKEWEDIKKAYTQSLGQGRFILPIEELYCFV